MKKVLSIDGGGIRGVVPASFLATVEAALDKRCVDHFDLIVGTSTGGIIALGLAAGLPAEEIVAFYERYGPRIFRGNRVARFVRQFAVTKYDNAQLRVALDDVFGDRTLGESIARVVIPSVNVNTGEVHIFKTAHHPKFYLDHSKRVVEVALATSAAPTYFPTYVSEGGTPLLDGGLYANNPAGLAAVESLAVLGWPASDVTMLSVGCGAELPTTKVARRRRAGFFGWGRHLASVTLRAQSSYSLGTAHLLIGHEAVTRIDPRVQECRYGLDTVKELADLRGLGGTAARSHMHEVDARFFQAPAERFVPDRR